MDISQIITREEYNSTKELSYDHFCSLMTKLVKLCVEESLKILPQVAVHVSANAAYLKKSSENFYKDNKDLAQHKRLMAETIMKVEGENPGLKFTEVLDKAAEEARKVIPNLTLKPTEGRRDLNLFDNKLKDL